MTNPQPDMPYRIGAVFDLDLGPDCLTHTSQWIRVMCVDTFTGPDGIARVRFRAIGGGPTNVPRWELWQTLVYDATRVQSMVTTGTLCAVEDVSRQQRERNEELVTRYLRKQAS